MEDLKAAYDTYLKEADGKPLPPNLPPVLPETVEYQTPYDLLTDGQRQDLRTLACDQPDIQIYCDDFERAYRFDDWPPISKWLRRFPLYGVIGVAPVSTHVTWTRIAFHPFYMVSIQTRNGLGTRRAVAVQCLQ